MEYFWETELKFSKFLAQIFDTYKRKYSLIGNGIYNLITIDGDLYELKYTQTKKMLENDNHDITLTKQKIIDTITSNLKTTDFAINGGKYITLPVDKWIAKIEIIKKLKEPV